MSPLQSRSRTLVTLSLAFGAAAILVTTCPALAEGLGQVCAALDQACSELCSILTDPDALMEALTGITFPDRV